MNLKEELKFSSERAMQINSIGKECGKYGWDSYNAESITSQTIQLALNISSYLDGDWQVSPTGGGEIQFEKEYKIISVIDLDLSHVD